MLIQRVLISLCLFTLSGVLFANSKQNCNDFKNDRARQQCWERQHNNNRNCNDIKNERARERCWEERNNNNHRNCNDLQNERARERCWNESNHSNNNWNRPSRPAGSSGRTYSEAQRFCAPAGRADDFNQCMSSQGFPTRR